MGGRLVAEALSDRSFDRQILHQLVFAAPDIDAKTFKDLSDEFKRCAGRVTLYVSDNDRALQLSRTVHEYPRAGEAGIGLVVVSGLDTIDVSALDTSFSGHGYFGDNRTVISDLINVILNGLPPENRGLKPDHWNGLRYWRFAQ
jgi:esterase/lipase superfamily enzyme